MSEDESIAHLVNYQAALVLIGCHCATAAFAKHTYSTHHGLRDLLATFHARNRPALRFELALSATSGPDQKMRGSGHAGDTRESVTSAKGSDAVLCCIRPRLGNEALRTASVRVPVSALLSIKITQTASSSQSRDVRQCATAQLLYYRTVA